MLGRLSFLLAVFAVATPLLEPPGPGGAMALAGFIDRAEAATPAQKRKDAERRRKKEQQKPDAASPAPEQPRGAAKPAATPPQPPATLARENVEADVSTRSIAVTSGFTGTEIVVFGSVDNSRQPSAESGYYDVVVVVEGTPAPLVARKRSNVAGLWINTAAAVFNSVPSYYAIASTRPIEEIADPALLVDNAIGMDFALLAPTSTTTIDVTAAELKDYRAAVVRLKEKENLYFRNDYGAAFIGRSLFRSSIELPANVPVGPLTARVFLFRDGELLSNFSTRVRLEREGLELLLYRFAKRHSLLYGLFAVAVAVAAGLLASTVFRRPAQ